jgi:succinyl-CoA synthetase beta subunit
MRLLEFHAKELLRRYGVATPQGRVALTLDETETAARQIGSDPLFVKAQILAGDRAAAGGVRMVHTPSEARGAAAGLLGRKLITSQTGPNGYVVERVLVERGVQAAREFYFAMRVDPSSASIMAIAGPYRRSGIERHLAEGAQDFQTLRLGINGVRQRGDIPDFCRGIGLPDAMTHKFGEFVDRIHRAFIGLDASLIEINPLILSKAGELVAADVKLAIDDNAIFRHQDIAQSDVSDEVDEIRAQAQEFQLNYLQMDGDIGIVANGTGLGLATLDMVHAAGGSPANFMDIRTTAKSLDIAHGIGMILDNPHTKVLLVNVFGGGMQSCDTVADGLGIAFRRSGRVIPLVLRITGNSENFARSRLANFKLPSIECTDMWQAAIKATEIARGAA